MHLLGQTSGDSVENCFSGMGGGTRRDYGCVWGRQKEFALLGQATYLHEM